VAICSPSIISASWKLKALATKPDALLSEVCFELKLMNQSQGIELQTFLYVLDPSEILSEEKGWSLPKDYNQDHVLQTVLALKELWESLYYWYYDGKLQTFVEWKSVWNPQAQKWHQPLIL
jgi:hypothetical protein